MYDTNDAASRNIPCIVRRVIGSRLLWLRFVIVCLVDKALRISLHAMLSRQRQWSIVKQTTCRFGPIKQIEEKLAIATACTNMW